MHIVNAAQGFNSFIDNTVCSNNKNNAIPNLQFYYPVIHMTTNIK